MSYKILKVVLISGVLFFVPNASAQTSLSVGYVSDDNIYDDVSAISDSIIIAEFSHFGRSRLSRGLVARYGLGGNYRNYSKNNVETNFSISGDAEIEKEVWLFSLVASGYGEGVIFPNLTTYNYSFLNAKPGIRFYPFATTSLGVFYVVESVNYPNYNLDYNSSDGMEFSFVQDIGTLDSINLTARGSNRIYPERFIYISTATLSDKRRSDNINSAGISFSKYIGKDFSFYLGVFGEQNNSNANEVVFDPTVSPSSNTLVSDYYSYNSKKLLAGFSVYPLKDFAWTLRASYDIVEYSERPGRDSEHRLLKDKRKDGILSLETKLKFNFPQTDSGRAAVELGYSFLKNDTNDSYYKSTSNTLAAKLIYYF